MTTLAKVKAAARKHGASIERRRSSNVTMLEIVAPEGFIWNEGDCSSLIVSVESGFKFELDDYQDLISRMEEGVRSEAENN